MVTRGMWRALAARSLPRIRTTFKRKRRRPPPMRRSGTFHRVRPTAKLATTVRRLSGRTLSPGSPVRKSTAYVTVS
jgi:hypothetical protein